MQVIATAGHVDHGKSALVRALTGMEPDRWAEERRRGLTIAALEATLAGPVPPVAAALTADPASLFNRAERAVVHLADAGLDARVAAARAAVGGGGAPGVELDSAAVSLPEALAAPLRRGALQLDAGRPATAYCGPGRRHRRVETSGGQTRHGPFGSSEEPSRVGGQPAGHRRYRSGSIPVSARTSADFP